MNFFDLEGVGEDVWVQNEHLICKSHTVHWDSSVYGLNGDALSPGSIHQSEPGGQTRAVVLKL